MKVKGRFFHLHADVNECENTSCSQKHERILADFANHITVRLRICIIVKAPQLSGFPYKSLH